MSKSLIHNCRTGSVRQWALLASERQSVFLTKTWLPFWSMGPTCVLDSVSRQRRLIIRVETRIPYAKLVRWKYKPNWGQVRPMSWVLLQLRWWTLLARCFIVVPLSVSPTVHCWINSNDNLLLGPRFELGYPLGFPLSDFLDAPRLESPRSGTSFGALVRGTELLGAYHRHTCILCLLAMLDAGNLLVGIMLLYQHIRRHEIRDLCLEDLSIMVRSIKGGHSPLPCLHLSKCSNSCCWHVSRWINPSSHDTHRQGCGGRWIGSDRIAELSPACGRKESSERLFLSTSSSWLSLLVECIFNLSSSPSSCSTSDTDSGLKNVMLSTRVRRCKEGRRYGFLFQHQSSMDHMSSAISAQDSREGWGSGPRRTARITAESFLISENGRRPVRICELLLVLKSIENEASQTSTTVIPNAHTSDSVVSSGTLSSLSSSPSQGARSSYAIQRHVPPTVFVVNPDDSNIRERPKSVMLASRLSLTRILDYIYMEWAWFSCKWIHTYCFHISVYYRWIESMEIIQAWSDLCQLSRMHLDKRRLGSLVEDVPTSSYQL